MPKEIGEAYLSLLQKICKGEGMPGEWIMGNPILNKEEDKETKDYRGITLLDTAYKIYAGILNDRLEKELERKIREEQLGFREERGTIDDDNRRYLHN